MKIAVVIEIDFKEDIAGVCINMARVRARLRDILTDVTEHDETLDWRVVGIEGLAVALDAAKIEIL